MNDRVLDCAAAKKFSLIGAPAVHIDALAWIHAVLPGRTLKLLEEVHAAAAKYALLNCGLASAARYAYSAVASAVCCVAHFGRSALRFHPEVAAGALQQLLAVALTLILDVARRAASNPGR